MRRYRMVVLSRPAEGREAEYNDWYQNVHLGQVTALKDIRSAQRYRLARALTEGGAYPYAAIYEIETADIDAVLDDLRSAAVDGRLSMSTAIDTAGAYASVYEDFGPSAHKP